MKTSKITVFFILMLISGLTLNSRAQMYLGAKAGLNLATFSGSDKPDDLKMLPGLNAGLFGTIPVNEMFAIQAEVNFEQKGSGAKDATDQFNDYLVHTSDWKWVLNYITVPVLAKATLGQTTQFNLYLGPYAGFLMSAKMKGTAEYENQINPDESYTEEVDDDIKDSFKGFDYGVTMGVGVKVPLSQQLSFTGDVRYNHGFAKLDSDGESKMYNSAIGISVGVAVNIAE